MPTISPASTQPPTTGAQKANDERNESMAVKAREAETGKEAPMPAKPFGAGEILDRKA